MKARATAVTLALCLLGVAVCLAADAFMGTWKLNEAQSNVAPGTPKNTTVVYEAAGENVKITVEGIDSEGKPTHNEWTGKFDGKDYAVIGDASSDVRSYKKLDDRMLTFTAKKGSRVTLTGRIFVWENDKGRTVVTTAIDSKGHKVISTAIYDKQ